jgi:hypothetical protein
MPDYVTSNADNFFKALKALDPEFDRRRADLLFQIANAAKSKKCVVSHCENGYSTLVSNNFGWQSICGDAAEMSQFFKGFMLAAGCKGDSLFAMYVFDEGKLQGSHMAGHYAGTFYEHPQTGDADVFAKLLRVDRDAIDSIFRGMDYSLQPDAFSKLLGIELIRSYDSVLEDEELSKLFKFIC